MKCAKGLIVDKVDRWQIKYVMDKVEFQDNGCWNWTGKLNNGYGSIVINKRAVRVTKFVYAWCCGEVPDAILVRHLCHNTRCVNPEHLEIGTQLDNMRDRREAGRQPRGEEWGCSKQTDEGILRAAEMFKDGTSIRQIAKLFGLHHETIRAALTGKTFTHLKLDIDYDEVAKRSLRNNYYHKVPIEKTPEMWQLWKGGMSFVEIAKVYGISGRAVGVRVRNYDSAQTLKFPGHHLA